jgi:hypothetical protein
LFRGIQQQNCATTEETGGGPFETGFSFDEEDVDVSRSPAPAKPGVGVDTEELEIDSDVVDKVRNN